jgi:hypothetical protein
LRPFPEGAPFFYSWCPLATACFGSPEPSVYFHLFIHFRPLDVVHRLMDFAAYSVENPSAFRSLFSLNGRQWLRNKTL